MNIKVTNTGTETIHFVQQYRESTPRSVTLAPGDSLHGHAITYNANKSQAILTNRDWIAYFDISATITHTVE